MLTAKWIDAQRIAHYLLGMAKFKHVRTQK